MFFSFYKKRIFPVMSETFSQRRNLSSVEIDTALSTTKTIPEPTAKISSASYFIIRTDTQVFQSQKKTTSQ